MAKKEVKDANAVRGTLHKMVLASFGVVGVAQDEVTQLLNRMVERGEITEKDARRMLADAQREFNKRRKSGKTKAEKELESLLEKMNVPSKVDIDNLSKQVSDLGKRIQELKTEFMK